MFKQKMLPVYLKGHWVLIAVLICIDGVGGATSVPLDGSAPVHAQVDSVGFLK